MVKNIIGLLLGLSVLVYGGYYSTKFATVASKAKPLFTSSNIDLSEEKWVKPPPPPKPQIQAAASPAVKSPAKKRPKKAKKSEAGPTCTVGSGRIRVQVQGAQLQCKQRS